MCVLGDAQLFSFYAKLFDPRKQLCLRGPTYEQIQFANSTVCLGEAVRFCRDFRILPQLLTRGDIVFVAVVLATGASLC